MWTKLWTRDAPIHPLLRESLPSKATQKEKFKPLHCHRRFPSISSGPCCATHQHTYIQFLP
jgi:hypothetical protein